MNTQMEIGITMFETNQIDKAIEEFTSLLESQFEILGEIHPDIAKSLQYLGKCFAEKNERTQASKSLGKSYHMRTRLKVECPEVATLLDDIGMIHLEKGKLEKASNAFQDSLRIRSDCLGEDHYELSYAHLNLGKVACEKRDFTKALSHYKESMRIALRTFGLCHPFIGDIHLHVGRIHQRKCQFDEAKNEISKAIQIYESAKLSKSHVKIIQATNDLARVDHEELLCV
eukprot:CAMPEP_0203713820 /NCGR_PEP_ID=MMETSP0091-20130426/70760_1 /ASSEMBLY_ACC=CAM_ASM_001089 /TAXON_ID=426623 /ORGANISM="Chaetoceros affinis, Strain CCMP159" /LENGTH=228 /DNA_ID=CAMNT_0050591857 /DNA_START=627 /DNA_END=1313 /DNA_ORIENTATION=-